MECTMSAAAGAPGLFVRSISTQHTHTERARTDKRQTVCPTTASPAKRTSLRPLNARELVGAFARGWIRRVIWTGNQEVYPGQKEIRYEDHR
jgi:hypothetical protein